MSKHVDLIHVIGVSGLIVATVDAKVFNETP
jgi:hypothetical protein